MAGFGALQYQVIILKIFDSLSVKEEAFHLLMVTGEHL